MRLQQHPVDAVYVPQIKQGLCVIFSIVLTVIVDGEPHTGWSVGVELSGVLLFICFMCIDRGVSEPLELEV